MRRKASATKTQLKALERKPSRHGMRRSEESTSTLESHDLLWREPYMAPLPFDVGSYTVVSTE